MSKRTAENRELAALMRRSIPQGTTPRAMVAVCAQSTRGVLCLIGSFLGDQKWPQFGAWSEDAVEPREVCPRRRLQGRHTPSYPREAVRQPPDSRDLAKSRSTYRGMPRHLVGPRQQSGTPSRALPPALPQPHLARAHAQEDVRRRGVRLREVWRQEADIGVSEGRTRGEKDSGAAEHAPGMCEPCPCARAPRAEGGPGASLGRPLSAALFSSPSP